MVVFRIYGSVHETEVFFCEGLANKLAAEIPDCKVEMEVMFEADYLVKLHELSKKHNLLLHHKQSHVVFRDDELIGGAKQFADYAASKHGVENAEASNTIVFNRNVREQSYKLMQERKRHIVYLEFADANSKPSDAVRLGVVHIELFTELCPKAAENFMNLCVGTTIGDKKFSYKGCPVHRVVKDGWIQAGDVVDGSGANSLATVDNSSSIMADESFTLDFGFLPGGVVGFANNGAHSSGSQFFITMGPCEWMNKNFVGVGRVLQGFSVLRNLNTLATSNQRPVKNITIQSSGITSLT